MKEIKVKDYKEIPKNYTGIVIYPNDSKEWYKNGKLHNENGPAAVDLCGTKQWYLNGKKHNENGPAVIYFDGTKEWYLNGEKLTEAAFKIRTCKLMKLLNKGE